MTGDAFHRVAGALAARGTPLGTDGRVPCPAHDGDGRNLAVRQGKTGVVFHCHSHGCDPASIARALGLSLADCFDDPCATTTAGTPWETIASYTYTDERGAPLFRVHWRERFADGQRQKTFPQERYDAVARRFIGGPGAMAGVRRVLYRLPDVRAAVERGDVVYVCEGEKAADALRAACGVITTSAPEGAGKWAHRHAVPPYAESLRGARVALLADADAPGEAHMRTAAGALLGTAAEVRFVRLPGLPPKGDAVEWLGAGGDCAALDALVAAASPFTADALAAWTVGEAASGEGAAPMPLDEDVPATTTPTLEPAALHGVAGEIVSTIEPHTEAAPAGVLVSLLIALGCLIGRGPHQWLDGARHGLNLFALLVGPSNDGRKGTAVARARTVLSSVDEDFAHANIANGLSSGQGLIFHVRDAMDAPPPLDGKPPKTPDPGVRDKRLLVIEDEIAGPLRQMHGRENTLSPVLRTAWDSTPLRTLTRANAMCATDPHISIIGQITPEELRVTTTDVDYASGLLNRFLFVYVERTQLLPHGGDASAKALAPLIASLSAPWTSHGARAKCPLIPARGRRGRRCTRT